MQATTVQTTTRDLATVFFTEWDHLLKQAEKLEGIDEARAMASRSPSHAETIRTLRTIAASLERIGDALRHHAEREEA